ncbi:MAG TPA: hypothetical protein VME66_03460 [Candidatus Acidoferrales bacterium]|nr:hypothetical protein [Candidatus Acidoferrales bacterium]
MKRYLAGSLLFISMIASPAAIDAQTGSPIRIINCEVDQALNPHPGFIYHDFSIFTGGLEITFVNEAPKVADLVVFGVNYRGERERVRDKGTFSPGVTIKHEYGNFDDQVYEGPNPNHCGVLGVHFVDGTFWRAPMVHHAM